MHRTRLGLLVWPALAIAVAAPAMTANLVSSPLARDTLLSLPVEVMALSNWRQNSVDDAAAMSSQVPLLDARPMVTVRTSRTRPLNVVVVMLESVRADATSVYSSDLSNTPFLADLARESLVVDQMYAVVPRTSAAWVAILAGRYPANLEVTRRWAESAGRQPFEPSLPAFLRAQGYTSGYFSTATLHYENNADVIEALQFDKVVTREAIPAPASGAVTPFGWEDRASLEPINRWLDERSTQDSPFLLTVMTNVGHYPYIVPPGVAQRAYPNRNSMHLKYLNCIRYIDDYLRDLVDALRKRNLLENTVLIVLGDHGEEFFDHGNYGRGHGLYDEVLHIPMLIRLPQSDRRTGHVGGLRQQIDVLPTIVDALGFDLRSSSLPGRSMLSSAGHQGLFFGTHGASADIALREGDRKYVYHFDHSPTNVFDLAKDPNERVDVRLQISATEISQAESELRAWHVQVRRAYMQEPTKALQASGAGRIGSTAR